jgi:DNA polymerase-3 subunit epsilon/CBS domain-containing protein
MNAFLLATPLLAIDAVALDLEATSLDPARARIVEIGAVRIDAGALGGEDAAFRSLVNPGEPIPASSTAIHGVDDAAASAAPAFADVWPQAAACLGERPWIGHSIGYDLALIRAECARAGLPFTPPHALDTRLLAQTVAPRLAAYTLEGLCDWLGVSAEKRHSALGDAITAARVFLALAPRLRECGVRTLGEALRACEAHAEAMESRRRAGWDEGAALPPASASARKQAPDAQAPRADAYAYRRKVADVMSAPARLAPPDVSLRDALRDMTQAQTSSLFIARTSERPPPAHACGVLTERDALRALARDDAAALDAPAAHYMSAPLHVVAADAPLYVAIGRMTRLRIRHLAVVDAQARVVGALSARDLLRERNSAALALGDAISQAPDARAMAAAWAGLPRACASLIADGASGREAAAVVSYEIVALTARAAELCATQMEAEGLGPPPCGFAVLALGSAARGESLLAMDQDNALVFEAGEPDGPQDRWFADFAARLAALLHEAGVPLCKGGVMARNPAWRGSLDTWRARIAHWTQRASPQDLLSVDAFFDLRFCAGDGRLADALQTQARALTRGRAAFAKLLVEASGPHQSGLGLFGRLRAQDGRIDLKRAGLFPIVCMARALALARGLEGASTRERLAALAAAGGGGAQDLEALTEAQGLFLTLILRQQVADLQAGVAPGNAVEIAALSRFERTKLREALASADLADTLARDLLFDV